MLTFAILERNTHHLPHFPHKVPHTPKRFFLQVEHLVPADRRQAFAAEGTALLQSFRAVGLKPASSAWDTTTGPLFVVNYWNMGGTADTLYDAELRLPDVVGFNKFNSLVQSEVKNIVVPICGEETIPVRDPRLPKDRYMYLRVLSRVSSLNTAEYVARLDGHLKAFTRNADWLLGETYLGITGEAGTFSQVWIVPTGDRYQIPLRLSRAPWLHENLLLAPAEFRLLNATYADPNIEMGP